eukprot:m.17492 g.17492  ORF g.17492 m.17492 type:complete len:272 (-) comp3250_c0_seq1:1106-1921(-)
MVLGHTMFSAVPTAAPPEVWGGNAQKLPGDPMGMVDSEPVNFLFDDVPAEYLKLDDLPADVLADSPLPECSLFDFQDPPTPESASPAPGTPDFSSSPTELVPQLTSLVPHSAHLVTVVPSNRSIRPSDGTTTLLLASRAPRPPRLARLRAAAALSSPAPPSPPSPMRSPIPRVPPRIRRSVGRPRKHPPSGADLETLSARKRNRIAARRNRALRKARHEMMLQHSDQLAVANKRLREETTRLRQAIADSVAAILRRYPREDLPVLWGAPLA